MSAFSMNAELRRFPRTAKSRGKILPEVEGRFVTIGADGQSSVCLSGGKILDVRYFAMNTMLRTFSV
jgi:hypothetical protein